MKLLFIASICVSLATVCQARVGETSAQIEAHFGKPLKNGKPIAPATSAKVYQQGSIGYYVGYLNDVAVYEMVQEVEDDGDFGEDQMNEKEITAALKADDSDGDWTEVKDAKDKLRHWKSATGKLVASYNKKHKSLLIESAAFSDQRQAAAHPAK